MGSYYGDKENLEDGCGRGRELKEGTSEGGTGGMTDGGWKGGGRRDEG